MTEITPPATVLIRLSFDFATFATPEKAAFAIGSRLLEMEEKFFFIALKLTELIPFLYLQRPYQNQTVN